MMDPDQRERFTLAITAFGAKRPTVPTPLSAFAEDAGACLQALDLAEARIRRLEEALVLVRDVVDDAALTETP